jgi:hypothetical protein
MNAFLERLGIAFILLAVAVSCGMAIGIASTRPLVCQYWDASRNDWQGAWRTVKCARTGSDVRENYATPIPPTATGYYWTPEPTEIEPTATAKATSEPYPIESATPTIVDPYPESETYR